MRLELADEKSGHEGYIVKTRGNRSSHLSNGEKSILALSYFLTSLEEEGCDLENSIVVIDDPIDSQDARFLFQSYGLLRRSLSNAGQLFLLTHNYELFNLARDWMTSHSTHDSSCLYWIEMTSDGDDRSVIIDDLPTLLRHYKTEYQFLFAKLYDCAMGKTSISQPIIPNIARKVIENFSAFKWSHAIHEDLASIIQNRFVESDEPHKRAVGETVLKFINEYSHGLNFDRSVTESVLEAKDIASDVMEFIKMSDKAHYDNLVKRLRRIRSREDSETLLVH